MTDQPVLGIDLGTTNSAAAVVLKGRVVVIPNEEGRRTTPSVVAFDEHGAPMVGTRARRQSFVRPLTAVASVKRRMGSRHRIAVGGREYLPEEISSMILGSLKRDAEKYLGCEVPAAVIAAPAYFNDAQRQATKEAGSLAGFDVLRIVSEPTASALAYGIGRAPSDCDGGPLRENASPCDRGETILVYDLGGGTFDVSVLSRSGRTFTVLATSGINQLGGDDFDARIRDHLVTEFAAKEGLDLSHDAIAGERLLDAAGRARIELSYAGAATVEIPYIAIDRGRPISLRSVLTREQLDDLIRDLVERTLDPVRQALADARVDAGGIDRLLLAGGATRTPLVQQMVQELLHRAPERGVNPDESVAIGAAVQGAMLVGEVTDMVLLDVTALTLGVEDAGGRVVPLIRRNTTIPVTATEIFTTAADGQTSVEVHVVQGERTFASDNASLGRFQLDGIPAAVRGANRIQVTFSIDADGIVHATARDIATGMDRSIAIRGGAVVPDDRVRAALDDYRRHESDDRSRGELLALEEAARAKLGIVGGMLERAGAMVTPADRRRIEEAASSLRRSLAARSADTIRTAADELDGAVYEASRKIGAIPVVQQRPDEERMT